MSGSSPSSGGRGWLAGLILLLGLLALAYLALVQVVAGETPRRATVGGVDVSGLSREAAVERLERAAEEQLAEPVELVVDGRVERIPASELGLGLEAEESLEGLIGRTWDPRDLQQRTTRSVERGWVRSVDDERLRRAVGTLAEDTEVEAAPARVGLQGTQVRVEEGTSGRELDRGATVRAVREAWLDGEPRVRAEVRTVEPPVRAQELRDFVEGTLEPALAEPVTLVATPRAADGREVDGLPRPREVELPPRELARMLSVDGEPGRPSLSVDAAAWVEDLPGSSPLATARARDASVELTDTAARIVPARPARSVAVGDVESAVERALRAPERRAAVPVRMTPAEEEGKDWRIERMATFSTVLPGGEENAGRTHNIRTLAKALDGYVVDPGEQFSLLEVMGSPTEENGYEEAHVISRGRLKNAVGGGLSQVSTAVYNVAFLAGVQLDEHKAHSYYIARYPEGREATLWHPVIDNTWTNDTEAPVVLRSEVRGDELVLTLYGEKRYEVESRTGERREVVEPRQYFSRAEDCISQHGVEGFDITVSRHLTPVGGSAGEKRVERTETHYDPSDEVYCTHPEAPGYSGSQWAPSDDYRPIELREQDRREDERRRREADSRGAEQG